jgi:hypothetical protein
MIPAWITTLLDGKKTYSAAIGFVLLAASCFISGDAVGGFQALLLALTAFGLRDAIAKAIVALLQSAAEGNPNRPIIETHQAPDAAPTPPQGIQPVERIG